MDHGILTFLSKENINLHTSYVESLRLKYSILQKSCDGLLDWDVTKLFKMRLPHDLKEEAIRLLSLIESHKLYFSSFCENTHVCREIRSYYSSEQAFMYEMLLAAKDSREDFLFVCRDNHGKPIIASDKKYTDVIQKYTPCLAIDLCEHSYFLDYGFDREEYIRRAIEHIDLLKLIKT